MKTCDFCRKFTNNFITIQKFVVTTTHFSLVFRTGACATRRRWLPCRMTHSSGPSGTSPGLGEELLLQGFSGRLIVKREGAP